jgi:hypothetical protein
MSHKVGGGGSKSVEKCHLLFEWPLRCWQVFFIILFISTWHHNITNEWKSCLSLLSERREMRASENAILSLGVGSNPGPLAPESCVLPCAPLHIHVDRSYANTKKLRIDMLKLFWEELRRIKIRCLKVFLLAQSVA